MVIGGTGIATDGRYGSSTRVEEDTDVPYDVTCNVFCVMGLRDKA